MCTQYTRYPYSNKTTSRHPHGLGDIKYSLQLTVGTTPPDHYILVHYYLVERRGPAFQYKVD